VQSPAAHHLRIIVVDDDFLVAMNTSAMLEDLGHDVFETHSGALALKALAENGDFDLMITDQAMPQMTGTQLIEAARALRPHLAVVLATGYAELPAGADETIPRLSKPFFQADLERVLSQIAPPN
jgi:CheY-like chemotaxis protein